MPPTLLTFGPMRNVRFVIAIAVAALLLITFLDRFILLELLLRRCGLAAVVAALMTLAAGGAGYLARRLRTGFALNLAVGYPLFGTLSFLAGLIAVNGATMALVALPLAGAGVASILKGRAISAAAVGPPIASPAARTSDVFAAFAIGLVLLAGFIAAQAPPSTLDELAYHLAIPAAWVAEGRAVELPLISHSYFPLGVESADLLPLALLGRVDGGIASHFMHLVSAACAIVLVRRRCGSLLVTAAVGSTPALALTAGWSLVDWPLLAACFALLEDDDDTRSAALAAGLLTKYTFLPFAIVVIAITRRWRGLLPGAIAGAVFYIRNLVLDANPIAPFLGANAPHVSGYRELTLGSYVFDGRFIDESLGISLLALLPTISGALAIAVAAAAALLWLLAPSARLLVPFLASAVANKPVELPRAMRGLLAAAVTAQLLLVGFFVERSEAFSLLSGRSGEAEYLARARPTYATSQWIDATLPPDSRTLVVGLGETYWFSHRVRGGGNFDGPRVSSYFDAATPEALRDRLKADGITHVAVVTPIVRTASASKREERETRLSPSAQRSMAQFLDRYAASVSAREDGAVFALK